MENNCPNCKQQFRRKIEDWMIFTCKECQKDMCKEASIYLLSGQCRKCFQKEFKQISKQLNKVKEKIVEKSTRKEKPKIKQQGGLGKFF